ncbi:AraC family transcriptional regulator [Streptomyces flaveolus]|uniref:AraC family transcriptional regulator n=1 Tax=Streptomyces flaveolus TaxID=67297 RepID=UPI00341124F5
MKPYAATPGKIWEYHHVEQMQVVQFSRENLERVARTNYAPVAASTSPDLRGRLTIQGYAEGFTLTRASLSGWLRATHSKRMATRADEDSVIFCVHTSGHSRVAQYGRIAELSTDFGVLYEARGEWELDFPVPGKSLMLRVPRARLGIPSRTISDGCARALRDTSASMRLLRGYLNHMEELTAQLTLSQKEDAARAACELLTMVLRDMAPAVPPGSGGSRILLGMLQDYVRRNLSDASLDVDRLAQRHHVSKRQVYALFAQAGEKPGSYIREQRLLAAQRMLKDPRYSKSPVSAIGLAVGLPELRTLERAFLKRFGVTPAAFRRENASSDGD